MSDRQEAQLALWEQWRKSKNDDDMAALLDSLQPLIKNYISQFADGPIPYSALLARGNILARDSLKKYDPSKSQIGTHVVNQLQPMFRYVNKYQNLKYAPEYLGQKYGRYEEALRTLSNRLNRHPTHEEISEYMGITPKAVQKLESSKAPETMVSSLPEEMGDEEIFDVVVSSKQEDDIAYLRAELKGQERQVFDLLSGRTKKPMTADDISAALGIPIDKIYRWRRKWTKRLKDVRTW